MVSNIAKEDTVNIFRSVLSDIGASPPGWVIDWLIYKLVDSIATSQDDIAFFECWVFHIFFLLIVWADIGLQASLVKLGVSA